ncbi:MAG: SUMF1/EgtB/PvdO family nonheme iron enzyme [Bacteroidetes bacterium]|nr:SUMF1/EgtB/PvdO family nonheme iron enzyme [Bacteroidota bacterium]
MIHNINKFRASKFAIFIISIMFLLCNNSAKSQTAELIYVDSGAFNMGYNYPSNGEWWYPVITPVHRVFVSSFYIEKFEIFKSQWDEVYNWAINNAYIFDNTGNSKDTNFPVYNINWYDAVKWCNARSEKEGLTAVYYTDSLKNSVYRSSKIDLKNNFVKWNEDGYRLPTEAEWEKAARGKLDGNYYPWPSSGGSYTEHLDSSKANFDGSNDPWENDMVPSAPVGYYNGSQVPSGVDMANGYGLYDMAGNIIEWTWDWFDSDWYNNIQSVSPDTKGPEDTASGAKTLRGGSWHSGEKFGLLCAFRLSEHHPDYTGAACGFRCVRRDKNSSGFNNSFLKNQNSVLLNIYPNPFSSLVNISYYCPDEIKVCLKIYNINGQLIKTIYDYKQTKNIFYLTWDGKDNSGNELSNGIYFIKIESKNHIPITGKIHYHK